MEQTKKQLIETIKKEIKVYAQPKGNMSSMTKKYLEEMYNEAKRLGLTTDAKKEYVVIWHYCANYGRNIIKAKNATEAIRNHLFFKRNDIELIAFENSRETSAVKEKGDSDVLNPLE